MTIWTVEGILRALVHADKGIIHIPGVVWYAYQRWLITQGITPKMDYDGIRSGWLLGQPELMGRRAPGNTCLQGLHRAKADDPLPGKCSTSKGCGTVMRSAPFGLFHDWRREFVAQNAADCSDHSHGHPSARHSSALLALIIHSLVNGATLTDAVSTSCGDLESQFTEAEETVNLVRTAASLASMGPATVANIERLGGGWVAEQALAIAIYCALAGEGDVRTAMLSAVNHSGDSDSTGAICGNLLGAAYGDEAFPLTWLADVEARGILLQLADDVYFEATRGGELHDDYLVTSWRERYPGG